MGLLRILAAPAAVAALALPASAGAVELPHDPPVTLPGAERPAAAAAGQAAEPLTGLFGIDAGQCADAGVESGSWFRMVDPGGGHVENNDSPCGDNSWTPLSPGTDGGLIAGAYQPHPQPAFSAAGGGRADRITEPAGFFGVDFSTATNEVDPQTGEDVPAPSLAHDGDGGLTGDLRAFAAAWSGQHFNQGAPKPDGSRPDGTTGPTGTFDAGTGVFTLEWSSRIQGGPFNGFTGVWHLTGRFEGSSPGGPPAPAAPPGSEPSTTVTFAPGTPAGGSGRAPSAAGTGSSGLASTGGTVPTGVVAALAVAGVAGLAASGRIRSAGSAGRRR